MTYKLYDALYPVISLARICGLLPFAYRFNQTPTKNEVSVFESTTTYSDIDNNQHKSIIWHLFGPLWLVVILATYMTQIFYYQTLTDEKLQIFELFHEHASVFYIIFSLIIIQFKGTLLEHSRMLAFCIEHKFTFEMHCGNLDYDLLHKYSMISIAIFGGAMWYEGFIRVYQHWFSEKYTLAKVELASKVIMVFLNILTGAIFLAFNITFFMLMMSLRLRFKTVNNEINKIAKITEADDDDSDSKDSDSDDEDDTSDNDTQNDDTSRKVASQTNLVESPPNEGKISQAMGNKINNLRCIMQSSIVGHGIYSSATDNTFHPSNKVWSSPEEYDESNKFYLKIRTLADIHDKLSLNLSVINSIYSVQLLFLIGIEFVLITATLYQEYETIDDHFIDYIGFVIDLIFNLMRCAQVLMLIWICSNTCYHANRASIFIHKIVYMEESKLKREIENFSMQLLHNKVQVTAGGFFPVDFTLLYTIVGAVTTYLVILVQFHLADKEMKKKIASKNAENN